MLQRAVTFAEIADEYHRGLRADHGEPSGVTRAEALVAAGMLREFAHRLQRELAAGRLADEAAQLAGIAEDRHRRRDVGPVGPAASSGAFRGMSRSYPERSVPAGSPESGPEQPHVLTLADQWHGGGPLAVNRELSIALAELGCRVTARTGSPVQGRPAVEIPGLGIQSLDPIPGLNGRRSQLLRADGLPDDVDVIVGHGRFSGGAASYLRDHFY